jgi:hypothetical protein
MIGWLTATIARWWWWMWRSAELRFSLRKPGRSAKCRTFPRKEGGQVIGARCPISPFQSRLAIHGTH